MSTRATIKITEENDTIWVYHHSDGYPDGIGSDLKEYLKELKYWSADEIATVLVKGKTVGKSHNIWTGEARQGDDGYEITTCQHGDESYGYHINCDEQTITCYKLAWEEFEWKEDKIVEIPDTNDEI